MSMSNYLAKKLLDHTYGVAVFTPPTAVYVALYSDDPAADDSGTELAGNGYARIAITFGAAVLATRRSTNTNTITFQASGGDWVEATHVALRDALTGGNLLRFGPMSVPFTLLDGDKRVFDADDLEVGID